MKIPVLALLLFVTVSCGEKAFPDERFNFDSKYQDLISPYHSGDTLYFEKKNGEVIRIKITGSDSTILNEKGGFMNPRPSKYIQVYCDNLDYHRPNATDTTLVLIHKYPDNLEQYGYFALMNFRGRIKDETNSLISVFQPVPDRLFKNCFAVKNDALDLGEGPKEIEYIYVQQNTGIVALKAYNGDWWIKR